VALREALAKLVDRADLSADETRGAIDEIVSGGASGELISAFLVALRTKGETPDEVFGLASAMRDRAVPVTPKRTGLVDTCGTGGDGTGTMNISTGAALVVAGAGLPVAKHGNRALSSRCGAADILEKLGLPLDLDAEQTARCLDEAGIAFLFAPSFHPAMAAVMPVRRELRIRTSFNLLGPLINPARPDFQLVGAPSPAIAELIAGALSRLGCASAIVVHGAGGADELTLAGENLVLRVRDGVTLRESLGPDDVGLDAAPLEAIVGGTPDENAAHMRSLLDGRLGAVRDCVALNAGAALVAAGAATGFREGVKIAAEALDSGEAASALERLVRVARALAAGP
jgi:anthranilate phosphoribosyltransferase